ncbi:MAG: hypothetical protein WCY10_04955, partial [Candidatus Omnitrophota bacterium]
MSEKIRNSRFILSGFFLVLGFLSGIFFSPPDASAVQIKRMQQGDSYFDTDDMTVSVPIKDVVQSKAFILLYVNTDTVSGTLCNSLFSATFEADNSLIISRDYYVGAASVRYYIVEFEDGVFIQRGSSSLPYGPEANPACTTKNVSLPVSVDVSKSVAIVNTRWYMARNDSDEGSLVTASLIDDGDTLQLQRDTSGDTNTNRILNITWQVIEFQTDAEVQTDTVQMAVDSPTAVDDPAISVPWSQVGSCLLFFSTRGNSAINGIEGRYAIRGNLIQNGSNVRVQFTRGLSDAGLNNIRWYLVRFTDPSTRVIQGTTPFPTAYDYVSATVDAAMPVESSRSFPIVTNAGPSNTTSSYEDEIKAAVDLSTIKGMCYVGTTTPPTVWVTKEFSNKVYKYNADTGALIAEYTTGARPVAVCFAYNATPPSIWAANYEGSSVTGIKADGDGTPADILVTRALSGTNYMPLDIAYDP